MTYEISQPETLRHSTVFQANKSLFARFLEWATNQEKYHIGWVGVTIVAMAAVFFPITMAAILFNGANFGLIITAMVALALVVITNLAALPTRYTIPFFFLAILIDLVAVSCSFFS